MGSPDTDERSHTRACGRHGKQADLPGQIPPLGWLQILRRVFQEFGRHDMTITAAGVSFFALFALFPAFAAFVAFYGLFADPQTVVENMEPLRGFVPTDVVATLIDQMQTVSTGSRATLITVGTFSLTVSVWSAQQGVAALMIALNTAYLEKMPHGPLLHLLKSLVIAIEVIVGLVVVGALAIGLPLLVQGTGGRFWLVELVRVGGMALTGLVLLFGLAGLYRWVPDRRPPRWRWVGIGAALVVGFWTVGSILFSVFLAYTHSYTAVFGSLGAVVTLLTLTYATVVTVLVGAELNAQMEYQTFRDTTSGEPRPQGQRGAYVADHVADRQK